MPSKTGNDTHPAGDSLALDPSRRAKLAAFARKRGIGSGEALAMAVDRLLSTADTDDFLTADDVPEDLI